MHFNAAAEQWTRAKHNRVDVESVSEEVVWPAGALYPLTQRSPTATLLSSTSPGRLMKMHRIGELLCHTDNPDAWRSDRAALWNHFPSFGGRDCSDAPWRVIFCMFVMESKVWPEADGLGCVWKLSSIIGHPCLTLTPYEPKLYCLKVTRVLIFRVSIRNWGWLPLSRPVLQ